MKLISQHAKKIMEGCKERVKDFGLKVDEETLECLVSNRDLNEILPKHGIPTLYDYWVDDVFVLQNRGKYKLNPSNPYEIVVNTRPAISYYNDNNPDWLNIMIFYHVLGHIDFFQNNQFFKDTWKDNFIGQALADKRLISKLRNKKGHWVDYIIEFARGIDNLVDYYGELAELNQSKQLKASPKLNYYFNVFLPEVEKCSQSEYFTEVDRYNDLLEIFDPKDPNFCEQIFESLFLAEVILRHPEFGSLFEEFEEEKKDKPKDLMEYIMENSPFLNKKENKWMKQVIQIVRNTSLYFQPQIRTKIINEGWASYWHGKLFLSDDRIKGHEVDYAAINARVTSLSRVGLNPYAIGMRLISYVKELADKGKLSLDFRRIADIDKRKNFDLNTGKGDGFLLELRRRYNDFNLINEFVDQDFVDKYNLFVTGMRVNLDRGVREYYIKSRNAEDYKKMLIDQLYHPPKINFKESGEGILYLPHQFEGKQLMEDYIKNTMLGIEYLWGNTVKLRTFRLSRNKENETKKKKVIYTMENRNLTKKELGETDE